MTVYTTSAGPGQMLGILRDGLPRTRSELAELTGQSRSAVAARLAVLVDAGLVRRTAQTAATGGRPSAAFTFNGPGQHALAVDLGANHATYAVADLAGTVLAHRSDQVPIADGPNVVMPLVQRRLTDLLAELGIDEHTVRTVGIGLPGPVDQHTGLPTSPPIMPGWDGYDVRRTLGERFGCPVFVDNDANLLALGERTLSFPDTAALIFVKVATGIGAGIISGGRLLHGVDGAAGDLGHTFTPAAAERTCRCGNRGCLETVAGGLSIAATLSAEGVAARCPLDIVDLVRAGNLQAVQALREAGRALGEVLATCTALFNPSVIVIGGEIVTAGEPLLAGVRESVYSRALPLAARRLRVRVADSGALGGVHGALRLATDGLLAPPHLDAALAVRAAAG